MLPGNSNRRRIFLVPLAYLFATRLQGLPGIVSWLLIYPVPVLLSVLLFGGAAVNFPGLLAVLLAMLACYGIYELGYMENDAVTVQREQAPTLRLSASEMAFFEQRYTALVGLRLVFVGVLSLFVVLLVPGNSLGENLFLGGLVAITLAFLCYNRTRGRINLPLQLLLVSARFCLPGVVAIHVDQGSYLLVMLFCFPLANLLERSGEPRYALPAMAMFFDHRHTFRVIYYLVVMLGLGALWQAGMVGAAGPLLAGYFLVYRLGTLLITLAARTLRKNDGTL
ncbi:MAG: hypothetical protein ACFHX7_23165 [Pseudomonadota bacterium]